MPVSKKRKKDGKPVKPTQRPAEGAEHAHGPDAAKAGPPQRVGKPSNPFVAQQGSKRGAQRGR
jgi:hypothetical protein